MTVAVVCIEIEEEEEEALYSLVALAIDTIAQDAKMTNATNN